MAELRLRQCRICGARHNPAVVPARSDGTCAPCEKLLRACSVEAEQHDGITTVTIRIRRRLLGSFSQVFAVSEEEIRYARLERVIWVMAMNAQYDVIHHLRTRMGLGA